MYYRIGKYTVSCVRRLYVVNQSHFTSVSFHRYKGFKTFSLSLKEFNVLIGPNNCGKSTIIGAFRILAEALRKARSKKPEMVSGPNGNVLGYSIDLSAIPIATENVFYNYDESEPSSVKFHLSNDNVLMLFFPERGICNLICNAKDKIIKNTTDFNLSYNRPYRK